MLMKLFGKYELGGIEVRDLSLKSSLSFEEINYRAHTFGRHAKKQHAKNKVNVVERLANKLMRGGTGEKTSGKVIRTHGRLQGKKQQVLKVVEKAFDIVAEKTGKNPVQVLVDGLENSAPREEVTRVSYGGVSYQIAVDSSSSRRLDLALRNMTLAALMRAFKNPVSISESLADEIIYSANNDVQNSFAIKKRDEAERMARSAR
ncbi:30S ribosomal protein S7 [Candidatus Micrarchaeota archaeon]|nr:30S ribosomal protein S7 [Candidatus Micrarchaeota archaeon]